MEAKIHDMHELTKLTDAKGSALESLAVSVPIAGSSIGLGRSASYEAAKRGDIPTVRIGGRLLVPIKKFRRIFQ